jgi:hypothetical protein
MRNNLYTHSIRVLLAKFNHGFDAAGFRVGVDICVAAYRNRTPRKTGF